MKALTVLCISSIIALTGCASSYPVTYNSVPQGAVVVCGGSRVIGTTPVTVYYDTAFVSKTARSMTPQEKENWRARGLCTAQWASGLTARYEDVPVDPKDHPNGTYYMVSYPGDANARAIDEARSMKNQQMHVQQQQAQQQRVQPQQQPIPVYQPQPLPAMPATSFPSAPGRTTTFCRTLSSGTVVCY